MLKRKIASSGIQFTLILSIAGVVSCGFDSDYRLSNCVTPAYLEANYLPLAKEILVRNTMDGLSIGNRAIHEVNLQQATLTPELRERALKSGHLPVPGTGMYAAEFRVSGNPVTLEKSSKNGNKVSSQFFQGQIRSDKQTPNTEIYLGKRLYDDGNETRLVAYHIYKKLAATQYQRVVIYIDYQQLKQEIRC